MVEPVQTSTERGVSVISSVKLLVEAVSPGKFSYKVVCTVKLLVEPVPSRPLICPVKLLVEAVPSGLLSRRVHCVSAAARLRSRWPRFVYLQLIGGNQQIPDAEVPTRYVRQIRLFDLLGTAVQPK
jgi:hypothetical protein